MDEFTRAFRGVWIPREVWFAKKLGAARFLYAEIDSLQGKDNGGCRASNKYLASFMMCKPRQLQNYLRVLEECGMIEVIGNGKNRVIRTKSPTTQNIAPCNDTTDSVSQTCVVPSILDSKEKKKESESGNSDPSSCQNAHGSTDNAEELFRHWQSKKNLIQHRSMTAGMRTAARRVLRDYSVEELRTALDNYDEMMGWGRESYYGWYRYRFEDFFRAGRDKAPPYSKYLAESDPKNSMIRRKPQEQREEPEKSVYATMDDWDILGR